VYEIVPVIMDRSVVQINSKSVGEEKAKRWNKISLEAAKQCGRGIVPAVHPPVDFETAVCMLRSIEVSLMPYEELGHRGEHGLKDILKDHTDASEFGILVGPEGGFSDKEVKTATENKIMTIGLGRRILRTETVASALIPVIMFYKNEF